MGLESGRVSDLFVVQQGNTVDGRNPAPVEVGSLSHYLQGFIHPRWLFWISSINSSVKSCKADHLHSSPFKHMGISLNILKGTERKALYIGLPIPIK